MTKFEEYKNRILDIQYIFLSETIDLIDYQYIISLIHESIYLISKELLPELKIVLNSISFDNVVKGSDLTDCNTYKYLLNSIKNDLNTSDTISFETEEQLYNILSQLDKIIVPNMPLEDEEIFPENNQNNCVQNCYECQTKCAINNLDSSTLISTPTSVSVTTTEVENENLSNLQNFINQKKNNFNYFNPNYLKDYLLHNHLLYNECAICGLKEWQNNYLQLKIDFIDGNPNNQNIENIRLLCPNCFSQVGYHE